MENEKMKNEKVDLGDFIKAIQDALEEEFGDIPTEDIISTYDSVEDQKIYDNEEITYVTYENLENCIWSYREELGAKELQKEWEEEERKEYFEQFGEKHKKEWEEAYKKELEECLELIKK